MKHRVFLTALLFCCACVISGFGKDLEIAAVHLDRYSDGQRMQTGFNQFVTIANRSDKTIDLSGYSVTNNGKEILRIGEHIKLEKDARKEFELPPVKAGKDDELRPPIDAWFGFAKEREFPNEREELEPIMKRYLPYITEKSMKYFTDVILTRRYQYIFSEIALVSPQKEVADRILVTTSDVRENPYSIVAFLDPQTYIYTSVFRKGDRITVSTIPRMIPFQLANVMYNRDEAALSMTKTPSEYFGIGMMHVPYQKMTLALYRDKDFNDEIVWIEGHDFFFYGIDKEQAEKLDAFSGRKVYYKVFVTHPDSPELSLAEPVTGEFELHAFGARVSEDPPVGPKQSPGVLWAERARAQWDPSGFFSDVFERRAANQKQEPDSPSPPQAD